MGCAEAGPLGCRRLPPALGGADACRSRQRAMPQGPHIAAPSSPFPALPHQAPSRSARPPRWRRSARRATQRERRTRARGARCAALQARDVLQTMRLPQANRMPIVRVPSGGTMLQCPPCFPPACRAAWWGGPCARPRHNAVAMPRRSLQALGPDAVRLVKDRVEVRQPLRQLLAWSWRALAASRQASRAGQSGAVPALLRGRRPAVDKASG